MKRESQIAAAEDDQAQRIPSVIGTAGDRERFVANPQTRTVLSVVVPVYKEEGNIDEFLRRVTPILQDISSAFEIIFSLDPSPDGTEEKILAARSVDPRVKLIKFSRRFGQPFATLAGLQYSVGDAVVVIDV